MVGASSVFVIYLYVLGWHGCGCVFCYVGCEMNKKIEKVFKGMDKETQDAIKTLINIMMVKKAEKELKDE